MLADGVALPGYDPAAREIGAVHIGIGAFHRAHQAVYLDDCMALDAGHWRIRGISLRSASVRDQLNPQDGRYVVAERGPAGERLRLIGAVADVVVAPEDPARAIAAIADPRVHLVSVTVTEKGYCHDAATGVLDGAHPDIRHDLERPDHPRSAVGLLVAGLAARRRAGAAPPTLLCCDNLPDNGRLLARVLGAFAALRDDALATWIEREVASPSTMVDRIVPATMPDDIAGVADRIGLLDRGVVVTEPFRQWVVEDRWSGVRPALERVGVQLVGDVRPYEIAKLRMLNGAHSVLAYLGLRLGYSFVHEAIGDSVLAGLVRRLMTVEAAATLPVAAGLDADAYAATLLARFANPALEHRLAQIAADGSVKLPQRLLATIHLAEDHGLVPVAALVGVAGWMLHVAGYNLRGGSHAVEDPLAEILAEVATRAAGEPRELVRGLLSIEAIFGAHGLREPLVTRLSSYVEQLARDPADHLRQLAVSFH